MAAFLLLAQDHGYGQLVYVIAILILSGLGALLEKLKNKQEQRTTSRPKPSEPSKTAPEQPARIPQPLGRVEPLPPQGPAHSPPAPPTVRREPAPLPPPRPVQSPPLAPSPVPTLRQPPPVPRRPVVPPPQPQKVPPRRPIGEPKRPLPVPSVASRLQPTIQAPEPPRVVSQTPAQPVPAQAKTAMGRRRRLSARELRRAVVLSEILQPPVSLREG